MVLSEDGQSRMRVEGLPVEVGLVISVNEIWTEGVVRSRLDLRYL